MHFNTADVGGLRLFYREAGDAAKPAIVLLRGFPSSSRLFMNLATNIQHYPEWPLI
jgi:pimeloyl-ACP methyl ester carboxylesterase